MSKSDQINQAVFELWERRYKSGANVRVPLVYPPLKRNGLLFVGLNPSFSEQGFRRILKDTPYADIKAVDFFHWRNRSSFDLQTAAKIETIARDKYQFFDKFKSIARHIGLKWEHVDLFFYRENDQKNLKRRVYGKGGPNDFGRAQLELSKALIVDVKPKVIIVANAFAAGIFHAEFGAEFDEETGYHQTQIARRSVPTFLASMLTGQRAMDNYSYQRLLWHIKIAVKNVG